MSSYVLGYSESETSRLDLQHEVAIASYGGSLSPAARQAAKDGRIKTVLDLACGTGIWSVSASAELKSLVPEGTELTLVGADLAENEQWPARAQAASVHFETADLFNTEQLASLRERYTNGEGFDLVHVRYVAVVVPKVGSHWQDAINRFVSLVKVGGLLTHEESDGHHAVHSCPPPFNRIVAELGIPIFDAWGGDFTVSERLAQMQIRAGLTGIEDRICAFWANCSAAPLVVKDERARKLMGLYVDHMRAMFAKTYMDVVVPKTAQDAAEAQKRVDEILDATDYYKHPEMKAFAFNRQITGTKTAISSNVF